MIDHFFRKIMINQPGSDKVIRLVEKNRVANKLSQKTLRNVFQNYVKIFAFLYSHHIIV